MLSTQFANDPKFMDDDINHEVKKKASTLKSIVPKLFNFLQIRNEHQVSPQKVFLRRSCQNPGYDSVKTAETERKSPNEDIQTLNFHQLDNEINEEELIIKKTEALESMNLSDKSFQEDTDKRPYRQSAPCFQKLDKFRGNNNLNQLFKDMNSHQDGLNIQNINSTSSISSKGDPQNKDNLTNINVIKLAVIDSMEESLPRFLGENITEIGELSSEEENLIELSEIRELAGEIIFSDDEFELSSLSTVAF